LSLTYPFAGGDSYDWIANGLRLAGEDVRYSGRPPLLPGVIALLHRLSALSWLPLLLQGLFLATVLVLYRRAALLFPRPAALAGPAGHAGDQWHFVALHASSVPFYLCALASLLGLPGAILLAAGAGLAARRALREPALFLSLALVGVMTFFFVFLYSFDAKR